MILRKYHGKLVLLCIPVMLLAAKTWGQSWDVQYLMDLYPDNSTYSPYDMLAGPDGSGSIITDGVLKFVDGGAAGSRGYYLETPYVSTGITILARARLLVPPDSIRGRLVSFCSQTGGFGGNIRLMPTAVEIVGNAVVNSYTIDTFEWHVYRIVHDVSLGQISVYVDENVSTRIDGAEQGSGMPGQLTINGGYSLGSLNDVVETALEFEMDYLYVAFDTAHPDDTYTVNSEGGGELVDISTAIVAAEAKGVTSTVSVLGGGPYVEDITIGDFWGGGTVPISLQNDSGVEVEIEAANNIDRTTALLGFPDYLGLVIGSPSCSVSGFTIVQASESNNTGGYNAAATIIGTTASATILNCTFAGAAYMAGIPNPGNSALVTIDPGEYSAPAQAPSADFLSCSFRDSDKGFSTVGTSHPTFQYCELTANSGPGIEMLFGEADSTLSVDESRIYNNVANAGIDFRGLSAIISNSTIENNYLNALFFSNMNESAASLDVSQCVIRDNSYGAPYPTVDAMSSGTVTIDNSEIFSPFSLAIQVGPGSSGGASVTVSDSEIITYDQGIELQTDCDLAVTGSNVIASYTAVNAWDAGTFLADRSRFTTGDINYDVVRVIGTAPASPLLRMTNCFLDGGRNAYGDAGSALPVTAELNYCTLVNFVNNCINLQNTNGNLTVTNSILGNAQQESILHLAGPAPSVRSCHFFGNASDPITGVNPTFGDPVLDPDFNMTVYTDAIDTGIDGTLDNTVTDDYDETGVRPRGAARDRGAQENDLTPVILNPIGNRSVLEGRFLSFFVSASGTGPLIYDAHNLPPEATFNPVTRRFQWYTDYDDAGVYPGVTFTVTGPTGGDAETITITVNPAPAPGTGVVRGRVTRTDTGSPIPGANVTFYGSTIADSLGNYEQWDVPGDAYYSLTVGKEGFDPFTLDNVYMPIGGVRVLDVALTPSSGNIPPPPPIGLQAFGGDEFIDLRWDPSPADDLAGYNVYLVGTPDIQLNLAPVTGLFFQHRGGLLPATSYEYYVRAVDLGGLESVDSNHELAMLVNLPPVKVSEFHARPLALGKYELGWELSPSLDATEYNIYTDNGSGIIDYMIPIAAVPHPATSAIVGPFPLWEPTQLGIRVHDGYQEEMNTNVVLGVRPELSISGLVRTVVISPYAGKVVAGDYVTVVAVPVAGVASQVGSVTFEYRPVGLPTWVPMDSWNVSRPNPDPEPPFFVPWDISALPEDDYDLRAVAVSLGGQVDPAPPFLRMTISGQHPESFEAASDAGVPYLLEKIEAGRRKVLRLQGDEGKTVATLTVPPGAVSADTMMFMVDWQADAIQTLQNSDIQSADLVTQMSAISGNEVFEAGVTLSVPWEDEDDDGLLDGTTMQETDLELYRIDLPNQNYKMGQINGVVNYFPRVGVIVQRHDVVQSVLTSGATMDDLFFVPSSIETDTNALQAQLATVGMYVTLAASGNTAYMTARAPAFSFTGFRVDAGERVYFSDGSGEVQYTSNASDKCGPNGIGEIAPSDFLAPGLMKYSLVGVIGSSGMPFLVGAYDTHKDSGSAAKIYLGFNDSDFSDNVNLTLMTCTVNIVSGTGTAVSAPEWQEYR